MNKWNDKKSFLLAMAATILVSSGNAAFLVNKNVSHEKLCSNISTFCNSQKLRLGTNIGCLHRNINGSRMTQWMSSAIDTDYDTKKLNAALRKPSKALTVCIEYKPIPSSQLSDIELTTLSMQVRKLKAASLWTNDLRAIKEFVKEQQSAIGSFPGPCPVVFMEDEAKSNDEKSIIKNREDAIQSGITAIVLDASNLKDVESMIDLSPGKDLEIIWNVCNTKDVINIIDKGFGNAFMISNENLNEDEIKSILTEIPKKAVKISCVNAMMQGTSENEYDDEVKLGKSFKKLGFTSVLVKRACVGDTEDIPYATYVVDGMTSKASSEFQITGLTGSTNGHFGGVASKGEMKWKRYESIE